MYRLVDLARQLCGGDAMAIERIVVLDFDGPVDARGMSGTIREVVGSDPATGG